MMVALHGFVVGLAIGLISYVVFPNDLWKAWALVTAISLVVVASTHTIHLVR